MLGVQRSYNCVIFLLRRKLKSSPAGLSCKCISLFVWPNSKLKTFLVGPWMCELFMLFCPGHILGSLEPCTEYRPRDTEEATISPESYSDYNKWHTGIIACYLRPNTVHVKLETIIKSLSQSLNCLITLVHFEPKILDESKDSVIWCCDVFMHSTCTCRKVQGHIRAPCYARWFDPPGWPRGVLGPLGSEW